MSKEFWFNLYESYLEQGYTHDEADKLTQQNYASEVWRRADQLRVDAKYKRLQENKDE